MLNLPEITNLHKSLPKTQIYKKFQFNNSQQVKFDEEISKIEIVNEVSAKTIPSIKEGEKIKSFYVLCVSLKTKEYDAKNIEKIAKLIPQNLIFALQYNEEVCLAVFFEKLFTTNWQQKENATLKLEGFNFDEVWENIIKKIEGGTWKSELSLKENIELKEEKAKLEKEIEKLEKLARKETQPKKKFEVVKQKKSLELRLRSLELS